MANMWTEFKEFLLKQNAIALAIAVVIGTALNSVVQAIVNDLIMPVVAVATPSDKEWQSFATIIGPFRFPIGHLGAALLNFMIIGFVAWRLTKLIAPKPAPVNNCKFCKMPVDATATRCPHCTSQLAPA